MQDYKVTIKGVTPLLLCADNIEWADEMKEWRKDPDNKKESVAGDDRTPAWTWIGCLHHDGEHIAIPQDMVMASLMGGGAMIPVGKGRKTFKSQTQSGLRVLEPYWKLKIKGQCVSIQDVLALKGNKKFEEHKTFATNNGFQLFVKRAAVNNAKHVRVRPRFDTWEVEGTIRVLDDQITDKILEQIFHYTGQFKGWGDWRPGSKTPGPHGMFEVSIKALKKAA